MRSRKQCTMTAAEVKAVASSWIAEWDDIDFDGQTLSIQRTVGLVRGKVQVKPPKPAKSRRMVDLPQMAVDVLREHRKQAMKNGLAGCPWVFPNREGKPTDKSNLVRRSFKPLLKSIVDVPTIRFHDLRHTAATLMLQQGIHPKVVSERLGHANIAITMDLYSHVMPGMGRDAADQMDRMFGAATA